MGLWKDRGTGKWKYAFQMSGKMYGGGGFSTKKSARTARESRRIQEQVNAASDQKQIPDDMGFREAANRYLDFSARKHAPKTQAYKAYVYNGLMKHSGGDLPMCEITPLIIQDYLASRPSNSNYNRHRKDLSALFSFARKNLQVIQHNPCDVVERLPEERFVKKIPTQEEFLKLLAAAGPDERPLLTVLAHTLARIDEILRLKWTDVNFDKGFLALYTRKTSDGAYRGRDIPLNADLRSTLKSMWDRRKQDEWVFLNEETGTRFNRRPKFMAGICKRAGIPKYGFHAIRHFISSYLFDKEKIGKATIGKLLGHQSSSTTDIYLHSLDDSLRGAMQKLEGSFLDSKSQDAPATSCGSASEARIEVPDDAVLLPEIIEHTS